MIRLHPGSIRPNTRFPYTTVCRARVPPHHYGREGGTVSAPGRHVVGADRPSAIRRCRALWNCRAALFYLDGRSLVDCAPVAAGHRGCDLKVNQLSIDAKLRPEPRSSLHRKRAVSGKSVSVRRAPGCWPPINQKNPTTKQTT